MKILGIECENSLDAFAVEYDGPRPTLRRHGVTTLRRCGGGKGPAGSSSAPFDGCTPIRIRKLRHKMNRTRSGNGSVLYLAWFQFPSPVNQSDQSLNLSSRHFNRSRSSSVAVTESLYRPFTNPSFVYCTIRFRGATMFRCSLFFYIPG